MTDSSDVQHHLERGLFLLSRGQVYEARQSWRAALRIEPANSAAQDYLDSTESELNDYDRKREAAARALEEAAPGPDFQELSDVDAQRLAAAQAGLEPPLSAGQPAAAQVNGGPEMADAEPAPDLLTAADAVDQQEILDREASAASTQGPSTKTFEEAEQGAPPVLDQEAAAPEPTSDLPSGDAQPPTPDLPASDAIGEDLNFEDMADEDWQPLDWLSDDTPIEGLDENSETPENAFPAGEGPKPEESIAKEEVQEESEDTAPNVLEEVRALREAHRYGAARRLLQGHVASHPGEETILEELDRVESDMQAHYTEILGDLSSVPELTVDIEELYSLDLDQVGGYIISLVDGILTLEDIFTLSAKVDRLTVMQVLGELIEKDLVVLRPG